MTNSSAAPAILITIRSVTTARRRVGRSTMFRQVDDLLSDGRQFLAGDRFTAADLTFASLAAPVLLPAECRAVQPALDGVPAAMRDEILRFRETDAGRFALRMFSQQRDGRVSAASLASAQ